MLHRNVRYAVAATAAAGLVTSALAGAAVAAPHRAAGSAKASIPTLHVTIKSGKQAPTMSVKGPKTLPKGAVKLTLTSVGSEYEVEVLGFKKGYSLSKYRKDALAYGMSLNEQGQPSKAGLRHLDNAIKHTTFYGGIDATPKQKETATVLLNHPGKVYVINDGGGYPLNVHPETVSKKAGVSKLPKTKSTVITTTARRFSGAKTIPAKGTITVKNNSTESPHFLFLIHVKNGTTRQQVINAINGTGPGNFFLQGQAGSDTISSHVSQTLSYSIPKGEYVELCFFPDPKTGMPHALMGMVGIVHAK